MEHFFKNQKKGYIDDFLGGGIGIKPKARGLYPL